LLILVPPSRRHADTGALNLTPLKRLALSAPVVPSEPRPQHPYTEPLSVQVEGGLAVATVVESTAPPPPAVATVIEERMVGESTAPQATLEPPAGTSPGGEDVVMVPTDDGPAPPRLVGEHDVATSMAHEPSTAAGAASVEGAADLSSSRYVDFPGIGTIDLDATELPSNDREILEVATE
jgi:hypothetical protein